VTAMKASRRGLIAYQVSPAGATTSSIHSYVEKAVLGKARSIAEYRTHTVQVTLIFEAVGETEICTSR